MLLLAEFVEAHELHALGLVNRLVERETLEDSITEMVERLLANAPLTLRVSKEALRRVAPPLPDIDDLIAQIYGSADFREGVRSFLAKEQPVWTGR